MVKKYNCMGCHQFTVGQSSVLMTLPQYQTPEGKDQLPPRLLTEGARVNPDWMPEFLANPALNAKDTDRDGVRSYLKVRMPTFFFSPDRDSQAGAILPGAFAAAHALYPAQAGAAHRPGNRHGAGAVYQPRRALPEMPRHRIAIPRPVRHRAEFPAGARPAEAWLGPALDARSGTVRSRNGHAFRLVQASG